MPAMVLLLEHVIITQIYNFIALLYLKISMELWKAQVLMVMVQLLL